MGIEKLGWESQGSSWNLSFSPTWAIYSLGSRSPPKKTSTLLGSQQPQLRPTLFVVFWQFLSSKPHFALQAPSLVSLDSAAISRLPLVLPSRPRTLVLPHNYTTLMHPGPTPRLHCPQVHPAPGPRCRALLSDRGSAALIVFGFLSLPPLLVLASAARSLLVRRLRPVLPTPARAPEPRRPQRCSEEELAGGRPDEEKQLCAWV